MLTRMEEVRAQVAERDELIEIIAIALLTRKNVFILGDTGQAKSAVINLFRASITGTNQFERLMSKQTDEEALFGRLDLSSLIPGGVPEEVLEKDQHYQELRRKLETELQTGGPNSASQLADLTAEMEQYRKALAELHSGEPRIITKGKLPDSHIVFLDEIFKASDGNMRTYFRSLSDVLGSPLAQTAQTFSPRHAGGHRVLKSTKLEDAAYRDLRRGDNELDALEKACGEKLSTFPALSRDIYQSFYSLNVRRQPEDAISEQARRFNAPILNEVMDGEDYPAIKAACEGRQLPAYEAASEFISQVAGNLDELLEKASGKKGALNTLERLEQKRDRSMEELQKLMKQIAQAGPEQLPELEKQAVKAANQAQSQVNQTEAVGHMVRDQMLQNKEAVSGCFAQAVRAAAQKAESVSSALLAWGYGPDSNDPERRAADLELAARVGKSPTLMEVARYLGRLKELMDGKRKNGYAYGRGEKYSLELGGDINRAIASEFAMLAAPETLPLFLRKLQRKALKQYQRREPICKGSGDIICMLDESSSAESQAPWCKAVALALLDIAMRDQRRFAVIHFAGVGDVQTDLFLPGQYDREDVLRCAETFLNGNTDYETPLREALRLMEQEGFENADMVFVTDGECVLPDSFLEKLKAEQSARGFQITGILLDQEDAGFEFSLREFCTNVYRTSQLSRDQIAEQLVVSRVA